MILRDSGNFTLCNLLTDFKLEKSYFALRLLEVVHFDERIVSLLTSLISRIFNGELFRLKFYPLINTSQFFYRKRKSTSLTPILFKVQEQYKKSFDKLHANVCKDHSTHNFQ